MGKNHLQFAWRTLTRHPATTAINVLGLALGLCACIAIYTITHYEFSFDDFHPDKNRIYRVAGKAYENFSSAQFSSVIYIEDIPPPVPDRIRADIPAIESVAKYYVYNDATIVTTGDYFNILQYDWLAGNKKTALDAPGSIVLTESQALKQFGRQTPEAWLGKTLTIDDSLHLHVTGILKDWKGNTDFPQTQFVSFPTIHHTFLSNRYFPDNWQADPHNPWIRTLIKIKPRSDLEQTEKQVAGILPRYHPVDTVQIHVELVLQPLNDIHFNEAWFHDGIRKAHLPTLYGLMGTAAFILLLAIVNFINLATAQTLRRAKEIGVRKVLGGSKAQLMLRFLAETVLITVIAAILAITLVQPILHLFHSYLPEGAEFHPFTLPTLLFSTTVITLTTLLAGLYPAHLLASQAPVTHQIRSPTNHRPALRQALIVFQFTISTLFIIGSITASRQLNFMLDADLGFATNAVVTINNYNATQSQLRHFAEKARQLPGVSSLTLQSYAPAGAATIEQPIRLDGKKQTDLWVKLQGADQNFVPFYHLKLLAGHDLPAGGGLNGFLINATYSHTLGFSQPADAIGHSLSINGQPAWPIVGVIADFHESSLHDPIIPILIGHLTNIENSIAVRLANANALERLKTTWNSSIANQPFSYTFLDESIRRLYESDRQLGCLVKAATAISIIISCMGLIGLATFTAEQRKKEIAIRKVLGAGISNILLLLTKDFLLLITIAFTIATPLAAYALHTWLQNYAYRTNLSLGIFALAALTLISITGLTIAARVIKAARQNPVKNLHSE